MVAAALCMLSGTPAPAVQAEGYFRLVTGDADERDRTCYNLGISGGHYRLGNECDLYGEVGVSHEVTVEGVRYRGLAMVNAQHPARDGSAWSAELEQIYAEARGFGFAPDVNFWLGKRFYGRADVHILDTKFVRLDGAGFGGDGIALGTTAKLGLAFFRFDENAGAPLGTQPSERPARRVNIDLTDIAAPGGGKLRFTTAFTRGHDEAATGLSGTRGFAL